MTAPSSTWPAALWLVRHAESIGNLADAAAHAARAHRLDLEPRDADVPLSERGVGQAEALGRWLAEQPAGRRPTAVLVSPYERALATARTALAAGRLDLPLRRDERLRERDLGVLDRLTGAGIRERHPEEAARRGDLGKMYYRPPAGESWADVALRLRSVVSTLKEDYPNQRVLVVTHQAVIMVFRYVLEDLTEREVLGLDAAEQIANGAVTRYERGAEGTLALEAFNDADHVAEHGEPVTEEPDVEHEAG